MPVVQPVRASGLDVDALLADMSIPEKVGQLFLVSFEGKQARGALTAIAEFRVAGLLLLDNAPTAAAARTLTDQLKEIANAEQLPPLLIAVNHEGGRIEPIRGLTWFASNWQLGQVQPGSVADAAACSRGVIQGRELRDLGVNMNLAPVLDVRDNSDNTIIGDRSFSDDPVQVARLGAAYVTGLQSQSVLGVAKHFPGHGSTAEDSHKTLPVVEHDRAWMDTHELLPFRAAIMANVAAVMTAHVSYPALDGGLSRPGSMSPTIVTSLLRRELGFGGIVVSDDLGLMRAVTSRYEPAEAAIEAILAGNDLLVVVAPVERLRSMVRAVTAEVGGRLTEEQLNASVRRVLTAKQNIGLLGTDAGESDRAVWPC